MRMNRLILFMMLTIVLITDAALSMAEEPVDDMEAFAHNSCAWCHGQQSDEKRLSQPVTDWDGSIHEKAGIACADCHGGNPEAFDFFEAMDLDAGFVGKPQRNEIPEFCAKCHADSSIMGNYDIPTDQLFTYRQSKHGQLLFSRNDPKVPTCADCHGSHNIQKVTDRSSPVYYMNIPETCAGCHANETYMADYNIPTNQYQKYSSGIHGAIHYGKMPGKKPSFAPTCASCHGSHVEKSLAPVDVPKICGKCHVLVTESFLNSPHAESLKKTGAPSCISCHDNHRNDRPGIAMFTSGEVGGCGSCHKKSSKAFMVGAAILENIKNTKAMKKMAEAGIKEMEDGRLNTDLLMNKLSEVTTHFHINHSVTHALDLELVQEHMSDAVSLLQEIIDSYNEYKLELKKRFSGYLVVMTMLVIIIVLILLKLVIVYREGK